MQKPLIATVLVVAVSSAALVLMTACASSHEQGVKTNYMTQWTRVAADPPKTTDAAKAVLEDMGLKDVNGNSTSVDGTVTGKKADGTKVKVAISRVKGEGSDVSVTVGTMGDPELGAEIAKKIKNKAEMK